MSFRALPLALLATVALNACDIRSARPDFEYPASSDVSGSEWPDLAVTAELTAAGEAASTGAMERQQEAERLAARARALKARAERLRRSVQ